MPRPRRVRFSSHRQRRRNKAQAAFLREARRRSQEIAIRLACTRQDGGGGAAAPCLSSAASARRDGLFCDARLVCGGVGVGAEAGLPCHRVVLAALSEMLSTALEDSPEEDGPAVLLVPDLVVEEAGRFLDFVYDSMEGESAGWSERAEETLEVMRALGATDAFVQAFESPWEAEEEWLQGEADPEGEGEEEDVLVKEEEDDKPGQYHDPLQLSHSFVKPASSHWEEFLEDEDAPLKRRERAKKKTGRNDIANKKVKRKMSPSPDKAAPAPKEPKMDSGEVLPSSELADKVDKLDKMFRDKVGSFSILFSEDPFAGEHHCKKTDDGAYQFMAFVGIRKRTEDDVSLDLAPLAWSPPKPLSESELFRQYRAFTSALKSTLGLSDVETHHHQLIHEKIDGSKYTDNLRKKKHRKYLTGQTEQELKDCLERSDIKDAHQTGPAKAKIALEGELREFRVLGDVPTEEVDSVAFVRLEQDGYISGYFMNLDEDKRHMSCEKILGALFVIWELRCRQDHLGKCKAILETYFAPIQQLSLTRSVVEQILEEMASGEGFQALEKQCPECGLVFKIDKPLDYDQYRHHIKEHFFERFECDCPVTWKSLSAKRFHVQLVHMEGYVKCDHCEVVGRPKGIESHMRKAHVESACEFCGAVLSGADRLREHVRAFHRERLDGKDEAWAAAASAREGGQCPQCGGHYARLRRHILNVHTKKERVSCHQCGKTFKHSRQLSKHQKRVHQPKSEMSHVCPSPGCGERFPNRNDLANHMHRVHIKSRHLECRYEGCTMAYDDTGSRSNHERIKHGLTYPQAARQGLVPPLQQKRYTKQIKRPLPEVPTS